LKPCGLADFTRSAVLQGTCGSRPQLRTLRLASPANSTIAQLRSNLEKEGFGWLKIIISGKVISWIW